MKTILNFFKNLINKPSEEVKVEQSPELEVKVVEVTVTEPVVEKPVKKRAPRKKKVE